MAVNEPTGASKTKKIPRVCLCGRSNVGKSSLFNRLIGRKRALVLDQPGVTRDVYRARADWDGHVFELADLAGLELQTTDELKRLAREAALEYLKSADLVLFVVDGRSPLTPDDEQLARMVRSTGVPVLAILSKIEGLSGGTLESDAQAEIVRLGWGLGVPTSAEHNLGINDLKETIIEMLTNVTIADAADTPSEKGIVKLGVYGRPNVGKSTLVNLLTGEKRMITSPIAGTTVDTIDTDFEANGRRYRILDTAGIRRKAKTNRGVEVLSVVRALSSIKKIDVALFLIDGYEGVTDQDEKVAGEIVKTGKPVVLIVNKWDLCQVKKENYAERLRKTLGFLDFAPILFISADQGTGLEALWDLIDEIIKQRTVIAPTGELNRFIDIAARSSGAGGVKLYYASQTSKNPPTITFMVNDPRKVHFTYERYLKNELRGRYGWMGSPLKLIFRARKRSPSKKSRRSAPPRKS